MKNNGIISLFAGMCVFVCNGYTPFPSVSDIIKQKSYMQYFLIGQIAEKLDCKGLALEHNIKMFTKLLCNKEVADDLAAEREFNKKWRGYSRVSEREFYRLTLATPLRSTISDRISAHIVQNMPHPSNVTILFNSYKHTEKSNDLDDDFNCDVD